MLCLELGWSKWKKTTGEFYQYTVSQNRLCVELRCDEVEYNVGQRITIERLYMSNLESEWEKFIINYCNSVQSVWGRMALWKDYKPNKIEILFFHDIWYQIEKTSLFIWGEWSIRHEYITPEAEHVKTLLSKRNGVYLTIQLEKNPLINKWLILFLFRK